MSSFYNRKRNAPKKAPRRPKKAKGLTSLEKKQVNSIIKSKKEVYYIPTICYANNRALSTTFKQGYLPSATCFASGGLISASGVLVGNTIGAVGLNLNTTNTLVRPMGGIDLMADTANIVPIEGEKAIMKSIKLNLRVSALKLTNAGNDEVVSKALNFRCIVFKVRKARPAGTIPNLATGTTTAPSFFLNNINNDVGLDDQQVPYEFENLRTNSEAVEVLHDLKFKLMNPVATHANGSTAQPGIGFINSVHNLPTTKDLSFWIPCPKKPIMYDNTGTSRQPTNWDYRTYAMVFCSRNGGSYTTTTGYWDMEASMISRVQEY